MITRWAFRWDTGDADERWKQEDAALVQPENKFQGRRQPKALDPTVKLHAKHSAAPHSHCQKELEHEMHTPHQPWGHGPHNKARPRLWSAH